MTEKQFWNEVWERAGQGAHGHRLADFAVKIAKEAGAKFDPEPVELPVLVVAPFCPTEGANIFIGRPGGYLRPTDVQAREVVRRCNSWPELWRLASELPTHGSRELARILSGRS